MNICDNRIYVWPTTVHQRRERDPSATPVFRRRHPAAKALLLVAGLFVMGALYSVMAPPAQVSADTGNSQQIAEGKALFAVGCASCHGLNGEGQVDAPIQGPPLVGCWACGSRLPGGLRADADGQARTTGSGQAKQLFRGRDRSTRGVSSAALGPGPAIPEPAVYDTANLSAEDLATRWRAVPYQLLRVSQLRGRRWRAPQWRSTRHR